MRTPFSAVDEAVHLLDTENAPWSIQMEVRVTGRFDEARLRSALSEALSAHPMARARKLASRPGLHQDHWEIPRSADIDPVRVVECPDDAALAAARADLQSLALPLAESPPIRVRLGRHPCGDVMMLNANHAAMDAFGALRLLYSVGAPTRASLIPLPRWDISRRGSSSLSSPPPITAPAPVDASPWLRNFGISWYRRPAWRLKGAVGNRATASTKSRSPGPRPGHLWRWSTPAR